MEKSVGQPEGIYFSFPKPFFQTNRDCVRFLNKISPLFMILGLLMPLPTFAP